MSPSRYLPLLGLVFLFALVGVAQSTRVGYLERQVKILEDHRDRLSYENRQLLCDIYALSYPAHIAEQVESMKIGLMDPVELSKSDTPSKPVASTPRRAAR